MTWQLLADAFAKAFDRAAERKRQEANGKTMFSEQNSDRRLNEAVAARRAADTLADLANEMRQLGDEGSK